MPMFKNGLWHTEFWIGDQRFVETTEFTSKAETVVRKVKRLQEERKAAKKAEIAEVEAKRVRNKKGKIIDQPISEAFSDYYEARGKYARGNGPKNIKRELIYVEGFFGPGFMLGDIDAEELHRLREHRCKDNSKRSKIPKPISNRAVNITLEAVRWVLGWAEKNGREVQKIDWTTVKMRNQPRATEYRDDHHAIVGASIRADYLPIILFLEESGCRRREAVSLRWTDINERRRTVALIRQKKEDGVLVPFKHLIPLTPEIEAIIAAQRDPATQEPYHLEFVFTFVADRTRSYQKSGKSFTKGRRYPIEYEGLGTVWARFKREYGLTNVRLHDIRHMAATRTLDLTGDLSAVQDLLGHAEISTTRIYARTSVEGLRRALERGKVPPAAKSPTESPTERT